MSKSIWRRLLAVAVAGLSTALLSMPALAQKTRLTVYTALENDQLRRLVRRKAMRLRCGWRQHFRHQQRFIAGDARFDGIHRLRPIARRHVCRPRLTHNMARDSQLSRFAMWVVASTVTKRVGNEPKLKFLRP